MNSLTVSIAEGKKNFAKLIRASEEQNQKIIVSRRGNPVAVIVPYETHIKDRKKDAWMKIEEVRAEYRESGLHAGSVYEASRKELENKK
ncbi:MAG: type II toxin-antitoxin system Phd/YefM family antitoxin [Deltaproteobacteria bacterium]|nr:type II toxin-antitoxin system Phd/YefM family antitoxin [Deltaproteobacteria bacterium]